MGRKEEQTLFLQNIYFLEIYLTRKNVFRAVRKFFFYCLTKKNEKERMFCLCYEEIKENSSYKVLDKKEFLVCFVRKIHFYSISGERKEIFLLYY